MRIVWTENSELDLDDLYEYIAKDSPIYAEQFVDRLLQEVANLAIAPRMGRRVPEANKQIAMLVESELFRARELYT